MEYEKARKIKDKLEEYDELYKLEQLFNNCNLSLRYSNGNNAHTFDSEIKELVRMRIQEKMDEVLTEIEEL